MTQAIQSFLIPGNASSAASSPRQGAASLFEGEPVGAGFGEHLAEQSRRSEKQAERRDDASTRVKEKDSQDDRAEGVDRARDEATAVKDKPSERGEADRADHATAETSEPVAEESASVGDGADVQDEDADQASQQISEALVGLVASAESADTSALQSARAGEASRPQQANSRTAERLGEPAVAQSLQPAVHTETVNAVKPVSADVAANTTADPSQSDPLVLQTAAATAGKDVSAQAPFSPVATTAPSAVLPAEAAPATPGLQPGAPVANPAGAQLTEAQVSRESEQASLNNARIARGLANAVQQRGGAVTLRLTPPEIGTVRIQMQITGTSLAATLHTETASAHQMLTQQLGQLRASLESQGLSVDRLHVQQMQQAQPGTANEQAGDNPQQQPNDGRSRGQQDRNDQNARGDARDRDGRPNTPRNFAEHLDASDQQPDA